MRTDSQALLLSFPKLLPWPVADRHQALQTNGSCPSEQLIFLRTHLSAMKKKAHYRKGHMGDLKAPILELAQQGRALLMRWRCGLVMA